MRVLVVEDDKMLGEGIRDGLQHMGYTIDWLQDGLSAEQALATSEFDIMLLDLGLPGQDGMELLRKLRRHKNDIPVLIITARDQLQDRIAGLDQGADDYLVKPFDLLEVAARLRAITRRKQGYSQPAIELSEIRIDPAAREVTQRGQSILLSSQEYAVLETLAYSQGRVVSRSKLHEHLYGWGDGAESNVLEVCIHHLRKKLGTNLIQTVRGIGYIIKQE